MLISNIVRVYFILKISSIPSIFSSSSSFALQQLLLVFYKVWRLDTPEWKYYIWKGAIFNSVYNG